MDTTLAALIAKNTNTMPVYMAPSHAESVLQQIVNAEPTALRSPGRLQATLRAIGRKAGLASEPASAMEDDEVGGPPLEEFTAYAPLWMGEQIEELDWGMSLKDGIATLNLNTAITANGHWFCGHFYHGYDSLNAAILSALADDRVKGIFLRMDSPGGVVEDGLNVLTETIRNASKPIWVFADMACSAAYWIASQCPWIVGSRTGIVGSIGACIVHTEYAGWLQAEGVKTTGIAFGDNKLDGAQFQHLSEDAIAHLQAFVDEAGERFVEAVITGRPSLSAEEVIATEARWYGCRHSDPTLSGHELGLVDDIMSEQAAFEALVAETQSAQTV
jgi:ClpP class serine protease